MHDALAPPEFHNLTGEESTDHGSNDGKGLSESLEQLSIFLVPLAVPQVWSMRSVPRPDGVAELNISNAGREQDADEELEVVLPPVWEPGGEHLGVVVDQILGVDYLLHFILDPC